MNRIKLHISTKLTLVKGTGKVQVIVLRGFRFRPLKILKKVIERNGYLCLGRDYLLLIKEQYPNEVYSGRIVALASEEINGYAKKIYPTLCQMKNSPQHIGEVTTIGRVSWYRVAVIKNSP